MSTAQMASDLRILQPNFGTFTERTAVHSEVGIFRVSVQKLVRSVRSYDDASDNAELVC